MRWRDGGRSANLEDRRGGGAKKAGLGVVGIIAAIVISFATGANPLQVLGLMSEAGGSDVATEAAPIEDAAEEPTVRFLSAALVLFRGGVRSACGDASSAMGPFYCPADRSIYIDLAFYNELATKYGAPGDFAQVYVLAHEIGHHVQAARGAIASAPSVQVELQADCFAGVWAHSVVARGDLDAGDLQEGLGAASAVGDDRIQQQSGGTIRPESFTHGSSAQRMQAFKAGFDSGDERACTASL